ncbi:transporter substrate-binding domain-containing protein [Pseudoalteromonas sp.]|uniref:transporter substrate-binding domain-containing protein n=1 Tax=Pseudoalteromonas sp. TaxID=53249 RepID=UPI003568ED5E
MQTKIVQSLLSGLFVLLAVLSSPLAAQSEQANTPLIVGVAGDAPFVMQGANNKLEGISLSIWQKIAEEKNWQYQYKQFATVEKALAALQQGDIDLLAGPISITSSRVIDFRFSQPYYQSSLTIASRNENASIWAKIKPFFSIRLLIAVAVFISILAVVGLLFWLVERKHSPEQFPADPKRGIANGMWLAIVTMSTTGYGDMAPVSLKGRIVAGCWMVISLIFATSMIAGIASTLTVSSFSSSTITHVEQFPGKKIATSTGSPAIGFIEEHQGEKVVVSSLTEAMAKLKNKAVDAVVFDRPQLLFYKNKHKAENIHIPSAEYYKQGYGFAFKNDSELINEVNLHLLKLAEDQVIEQIMIDYLGKELF